MSEKRPVSGLILRPRYTALSAALLVLAKCTGGATRDGRHRIGERFAANAQRLSEVRANLQQALNYLEVAQGSDRRAVDDPCSSSVGMRELPCGSVNKIRVAKGIRFAPRPHPGAI